MDKYVEDTLVVDILLVGNKRSKYFYNAVLPKVRFKSCFVPELNFNVSKDFISRNDVKIIKRATVLSDLER
jgi:hypothetical protein